MFFPVKTIDVIIKALEKSSPNLVVSAVNYNVMEYGSIQSSLREADFITSLTNENMCALQDLF